MGQASASSLSDNDFRFICNLVYEHSGIVLGEHKREMLYRRIMRRTRELRVASFTDYCRLLKKSADEELPNFINAVTTNLTGFFRESHHFDYLKQRFIPMHLQEASEKRLRIWSAACSTGEEPYSIAISLYEAMGDTIRDWDVRVLATDIDSNVLASARSGIYKKAGVQNLPVEQRKRWFRKGSGEREELVKIDPGLQDYIVFKQLNLLHEWPMKKHFDVIFCRNVLIYFDRDTQQRIIGKFLETLRPGGILFLGHSESLGAFQSHFELQGRTIFRKPLTASRS